MTENMVRQIARVIRDKHDGPTGPNDDTGLPYYEATARAVLSALREPSQFMLDSAAREALSLPCRPNVVWEEMIDAALAEHDAA